MNLVSCVLGSHLIRLRKFRGVWLVTNMGSRSGDSRNSEAAANPGDPGQTFGGLFDFDSPGFSPHQDRGSDPDKPGL